MAHTVSSMRAYDPRVWKLCLTLSLSSLLRVGPIQCEGSWLQEVRNEQLS